MRSSLKRIKELENRNEEEAKQSSMEDNWKANHHQCSPVNRQKRKKEWKTYKTAKHETDDDAVDV